MEILIALSIITVLLTIALNTLINYRNAKKLDTTTDSIAAKIEEAKSNSISGKNGQSYGIAIASSSYTFWYGNTYSSSDPNNIVLTIADNLVLNTTLSGYNMKFERITGLPSNTGSITITDKNNASTTDSITIGTLGDISVIK